MARSTVAVKFTGDVKDLKRATDDAERNLGGFGGRVGPKLAAGLATAGVAAGAALYDGMMKEIDREQTTGRLAGSLGLSDAEAKELGETAGAIYFDGFGESFEQVAEATAAATQILEDFADPDQLEPLTKKALDLAYIFQTEVGQMVETAGYLLRNNLAADAEEAFDAITTGLQNVTPEMRGEALDALNEYSQSFAALGFDAEEAFALIVEAGQNTSVGIDKTGDAIKEFLIRSTDGSEAVSQAFEWLKLDAKEMSDALASGGPAAEEAFGRIVAALLSVEDPSYRAQIAVALFGTPIEDLSVDKIPEFLTALQSVEEGFGNIEGAADDATANLEGNAREYQRAMRQLEEVQREFTVTIVGNIMAIDLTIASWVENSKRRLGDLGGAFQSLGEQVGGVLSDIRELTDITETEGEGTGPFGIGLPSWLDDLVGNNAAGTRHWRGGLTRVGEAGPEIVNLPRGSEVFSASESRRMTGNTNNVTINVNGGHFDEQAIARHVAWAVA